MKRTQAVFFILVIAGLSALMVSAANASSNDDFNSAQSLPGLEASFGENTCADSKEVGEPNHAGDPGGRSVWFRWLATETGTALVGTLDSDFDTLLAVYTGNFINSLTEVASNDDIDLGGGILTSAVSFPALRGETYAIAVDGAGGDCGNLVLDLLLSNDFFDDPFQLTVSFSQTSNIDAGKDPGEPNHAGNPGGKSVWWRWFAPMSGRVVVDTSGSNFDTLLAVYTGSVVNALSEVASNNDAPGSLQSSLEFMALSGQTYSIAVDGLNGASGQVNLNLAQDPLDGPIEWTLANIIFDDGGQAIGSFVHDAGTGDVISWDISVANGGVGPLQFRDDLVGNSAAAASCCSPDGEKFLFNVLSDPDMDNVSVLAIDPVVPLSVPAGTQVTVQGTASGADDTFEFRFEGGFLRKLALDGFLISALSSSCIRNPNCVATDFCAQGAPDTVGTCDPKPTFCSGNFDPVCGFDGVTYSNECLANMNGVNVLSLGSCSTPPGCTSNSQCANDHYCSQATPGAAGQCVMRPSFCPSDWNPVCGFDGSSYSNACDANSNGQNVLSPGRCEPDDAIASGCRVGPGAQGADPVNLITGAFTYSANLIPPQTQPLSFGFTVAYDSIRDYNGEVGRKWLHSYEWRVETNGSEVKVIQGDGAADYFDDQGGPLTPRFASIPNTLVRNGNGSFTYTTWEQLRYEFSAAGRLQSIADGDGNSAVLAYDMSDRLLSVTDGVGRIATFTHNAGGQITAVDYQSQVVALSYDADGDLTSFTLAGEATPIIQFSYDDDGALLTAAGPDGTTLVTNEYDGAGRVIAQRDALDQETQISYADASVAITDPMGRVSTRTFDAAGRLIETVEPGGARYAWEYDAAGNVKRETGPLRTMTMSYDSSGNLLIQTDAAGNQIGLLYDSDNNVTGTVDANGQLSEYGYDAQGNLISVTDTVGRALGFTHNAEGQVMTETDPNGNVTVNQYSADGELMSFTDPSGTSSFGYDSQGRITSFGDQKNQTTSFQFDMSGAVMSTTDAMGRQTSFGNDAYGRLASETSPDGASTQYTRDAKGNLTAVRDPLGNVFQYSYDAMGKMTSRTDPLGRVTTWEYHPNGQVQKTIDAMGGVTLVTFDEVGNKTSITDPNGNTTAFAYDGLNRVISETDPLGAVTTTGYGSTGVVDSTTNGRGQTALYDYDVMQQFTGVTLPDNTISHTLDNEANRVQSTHNGGTVTQTVDETVNRITSRSDEFGNTIGYGYDAVGNVTTLTYSDGKQVTYEYDALNRLTQVSDWANRVTTYAYDVAGNLSTVNLPDGSTVVYGYDAAKGITSLSDTAAGGAVIFSGQYTLDAGRQTVRAIETQPLEPVIDVRTAQFTYDAGNQIATIDGQAAVHDADGNLISAVIEGQPMALSYDSVSRLKQAGSDTYRYDAEGLRIQTTLNGATRRHVWDPFAKLPRVLEEHDAAGNIIARYVYGLGLIGRESNPSQAYSVYHFDKRGSTIALTDLNGAISDRYAYDPYGRVIGRQGSTANPFTYNGRDGVMDDQNGLYFMRARYYVPSLMRFAGADGLFRGSVLTPATINRYAFVDGNPIDRVDPNGRFWNAVATFVGGAVVGAVVQVASNAIEGRPLQEGVAGAALEGGITAFALTSGPWFIARHAAQGALGSGLNNALNQGIDLYKGRRDSFDFALLGQDMAVGAALGGTLGKIAKKSSIPEGFASTTLARFGPRRGAGFIKPSKFKRVGKQGLIFAAKSGAQLAAGGPGLGLSDDKFGRTRRRGITRWLGIGQPDRPNPECGENGVERNLREDILRF